MLVKTWLSSVCMVGLDLSVFSGIFPGSFDGTESTCSAGELGSSLDQEDPLEKGMATESSILACRIPWTEEAGGLQSMWSQTVRHVWRVNTLTFQSCLHWLCLDKTACFLQWKYWSLTMFCVHEDVETWVGTGHSLHPGKLCACVWMSVLRGLGSGPEVGFSG